MQALIDLNLRTAEEATRFQIDRITEYTDKAVENFRKAAQITTPEALQAYWTDAVADAETTAKQIQDDIQSMVEMGQRYTQDFQAAISA